jgi:hypothetical protein
MEKQHVPLTVTADKSKAEFSLEGFSVRDARPDDEASVRLVDLKSGDVVFTWSVEKKSTAHSLQNAAEACVKQVRAAVVKAQQKRLGNVAFQRSRDGLLIVVLVPELLLWQHRYRERYI